MCQKYTIIPELLKLNKQNEFHSIMNSRIPKKNSRVIFVKNIVVYIFIRSHTVLLFPCTCDRKG